MRKLFTGRFGRIPAALLATVLISVLVAGGVVAATGGYTLWEGSVDVVVVEPVHIYYTLISGSNYTSELDFGDPDPMGSLSLKPGDCGNTYFKITSDSSSDLLIKATSTSSDETAVTVTFNVTEIATTGVIVNSLMDVYVTRSVCVDGAATDGLYTANTGFTRESAP